MLKAQKRNAIPCEVLHKLTEIKCTECGVNFDYCFKHIVKIQPTTREEFEDEMEKFLSVAYFSDFFALYEGFIPYRECAKSLDEVRRNEAEAEAREQKNLN
jgi:hypothetical protein